MFYEKAVVFKDYLPQRLKDYIEIDAINHAVNIEYGRMMEYIKNGVNNKSIAHADLQGVARWEKILGVTSPLHSTLESRRDALKARLMTKPPINIKVLKGIVEAYMEVPVDITVKDFTVKITYRGETKVSDLRPLFATAYQTIPANLLMDITYAYVTWGEIAGMTWAVVEEKTWDELRKGI